MSGPWHSYARNKLKSLARQWSEFRCNRYMWPEEPKVIPYGEAKALLVEAEDMVSELKKAIQEHEAA